jgi:hypothetical protein
MNLEPLSEDRHDEAAAFLASVFPGSEGAPFLGRELRHWKYYAPHPFSNGTRCYVTRDAEGLTAHGGVSPVEYVTARGVKTSFQVIDWAGSPRRPGAGFLLFRELWPSADSYLGIGGSDDARKVMRRIPSVRPAGEMVYFAYPLRPWGQLRASPWTWRSPLKWARSWKWRAARKRPQLDAWHAVPLKRLREKDAPLLEPASDGLYVPLRRTPELVNYWLACPAARMKAWRLEHNGEPVGLLVMAFLSKEARITDLVVNTAAAPVAEAFALAVNLAEKDGKAYELSAASSAPSVMQAMAEAGMIRRGAADVFLGDPQKSFPEERPIEVNLTIGDGYYQEGNRTYFHTF